MDGGETTLYPRYLATHLPKQGYPVCLVGQVIDISQNNSLTIDCDPQNKQQIVIEIPGNVEITPLKQSKFVEVRGVCGETGEVVMKQYTDLKDNFDLKTYNQIVGIANKQFKSIFNYRE